MFYALGMVSFHMLSLDQIYWDIWQNASGLLRLSGISLRLLERPPAAPRNALPLRRYVTLTQCKQRGT